MLVLSRKSSESIQIGDNIRVTIVKVNGGRVSIGIEAPKHVSITRDELKNRIRDEDEASEAPAQGNTVSRSQFRGLANV